MEWTGVQRELQDRVLIRMAKVGFSENTRFEQRLEEDERVNYKSRGWNKS